jgi:hypothetical protein
MDYWVATCQNLTGNSITNNIYGSFLYKPENLLRDISDTAAGILELTYLGATTSNASIIAAQGYINRIWNITDTGWYVNSGNLYGMYAVMKACRSTTLTPIQYISNYNGSRGADWFSGPGEYADALIDHQNNNGSWFNWQDWPENGEFPTDLSTAFGILILESFLVRVTYTLTVTVQDDYTHSPIAGATVSIVGPETHSGITGSDGIAIFNNIQAGLYQINSSSPTYPAPSSEMVQVSDNTNFSVALSSYTTASFTYSPSLPTASIEVSFNASHSNSSGTITNYNWNFGDNTNGTGITSNHTYSTPGNYTVTLTITSTVGKAVYSQTITVSEPPFDITPYIVLAIVIALLILLLILAILRKYYNVVIIQAKNRHHPIAYPKTSDT